MKRCSKCRIEKFHTEFWKDIRRRDGLKSWCITCKKKADKIYRMKYPEKEAARKVRYKARDIEGYRLRDKLWRRAKRLQERQLNA